MPASASGRQSIIDMGTGIPSSKSVTVTLTQVAAPAGGTGAAAGGYDTAGNRDLAIASINAARTDIIALRTVLVDLGLIT